MFRGNYTANTIFEFIVGVLWKTFREFKRGRIFQDLIISYGFYDVQCSYVCEKRGFINFCK